jgi:hypothetical protein
VIDRTDCWRRNCYERADYVAANPVGIALCAEHAAEVAGEVILTPLAARLPLPRLLKRDLPRSPVPGASKRPDRGP